MPILTIRANRFGRRALIWKSFAFKNRKIKRSKIWVQIYCLSTKTLNSWVNIYFCTRCPTHNIHKRDAQQYGKKDKRILINKQGYNTVTINFYHQQRSPPPPLYKTPASDLEIWKPTFYIGAMETTKNLFKKGSSIKNSRPS